MEIGNVWYAVGLEKFLHKLMFDLYMRPRSGIRSNDGNSACRLFMS